ncbi:hypothetical protein ACSMXM_04315 [Pacificimonas sp. ICDLI1SI03]|jgi:putative exporter of polyketide antibiotics|tara:strand:- start:71671 stop:71850 length:180 start_codon:yes stop_codon:yes gene_type:complete
MGSVVQIALSLAVVFAVILAAAGIFIVLRRPRTERTKGLLMIAVAAVTVVNIWLLTAPL